eukprot:4654641-Pleurochrysis_carterae.AAC.1
MLARAWAISASAWAQAATHPPDRQAFAKACASSCACTEDVQHAACLGRGSICLPSPRARVEAAPSRL